MAKKITLEDNSLPDLANILHNQGVSDLSWLAIDEEDYKAHAAVPKQNLDMIPEFQKALLEDRDDGVPKLIPLRPHTIVNSNPADAPQMSQRDFSSPIRNRVARLVMAGASSKEIQERLSLEFAPRDIRANAPVIQAVLDERGLLGNVYVDASHFPRAASDPKEKKLAQLLGKTAKFVIGGCGGKNGCNCHQTGLCSTFGGKRVVNEVPYGSQLAAHYVPQLSQQGRHLDIAGMPTTSNGWKERLRTAFLQPVKQLRADPVQTIQHQARPVTAKVSAKDVAEFIERREAVAEPPPSPRYAKFARRMMAGHDDFALLTASLEPELRDLAKQHGILGHSYFDVDAAGGCRNTLKLIQAKLSASGAESVEAVAPDVFLRRDAHCSICRGAPDGACAQLCKIGSMVHSVVRIDKQSFASALRRAEAQGRISAAQCRAAISRAPDGSDWTKLTSQANLFRPATAQTQAYQGAKIAGHYGTRPGNELGVVPVVPEQVRRAISHLMNTGLHGKSLQEAVLKVYSRTDLAQVPNVGKRMAAEEGVQGSYFVDPTAYSDYGRGCEQGAKHFRKRGAPNVLASESCTGCTLQTAPGWCSKYSKGLIRQVPDHVRREAASKRQLPVIQPSPPPVDPSQRYELASELTVDLNGSKSRAIEVSIGGPSLD